MPTTQNIERIIKDFSDSEQQYVGAHLFFIEGAFTWSLGHFGYDWPCLRSLRNIISASDFIPCGAFPSGPAGAVFELLG